MLQITIIRMRKLCLVRFTILVNGFKKILTKPFNYIHLLQVEMIYRTGKYDGIDIDKAIYYYILASNQNEPNTQYNFGPLYSSDKYISQNINKQFIILCSLQIIIILMLKSILVLSIHQASMSQEILTNLFIFYSSCKSKFITSTIWTRKYLYERWNT